MAKPAKAMMQSSATVGLDVVLSVLLGLFGGRFLDGKLGTGPWLAAIGFAFGVAAGARSIVRAYRDMQRITREEEAREGNPAPAFVSHEDEARAKEERRRAKDFEVPTDDEGAASETDPAGAAGADRPADDDTAAPAGDAPPAVNARGGKA